MFRKIADIIFIPSLTGLRFDTLPVLFRYVIGTEYIVYPSLRALTIISTSIENPPDSSQPASSSTTRLFQAM